MIAIFTSGSPPDVLCHKAVRPAMSATGFMKSFLTDLPRIHAVDPLPHQIAFTQRAKRAACRCVGAVVAGVRREAYSPRWIRKDRAGDADQSIQKSIQNRSTRSIARYERSIEGFSWDRSRGAPSMHAQGRAAPC